VPRDRDGSRPSPRGRIWNPAPLGKDPARVRA
jgi:hypothetical protein